jgi:hypothetical protein
MAQTLLSVVAPSTVGQHPQCAGAEGRSSSSTAVPTLSSSKRGGKGCCSDCEPMGAVHLSSGNYSFKLPLLSIEKASLPGKGDRHVYCFKSVNRKRARRAGPLFLAWMPCFFLENVQTDLHQSHAAVLESSDWDESDGRRRAYADKKGACPLLQHGCCRFCRERGGVC